MNERIQELAEQATRKYDRLGNDIPFAQPDLELFAELIIRECMDLVKDCYAEPGRSLYQSVCASTIIEEHFGVE